jgi:hypothetical protein
LRLQHGKICVQRVVQQLPTKLEGGCMDEVSAKASLTAEIASPLAVEVPRSEVERALQADAEADLILDIVRRNGQEEACRVVLALDREALEQLLTQEGERVVAAIDPFTLQRAFDDVEVHGMREVGATLAVLVATAAGGAGVASAEPFESSGVQAGTVVAEVGMPRAMPADYAAAETQMPRAMPSDYATASGEMPRAMPSDYAAQPDQSVPEAGMPRAMPADYAAQAGIENVRAAREAPEATPDPMTPIENVRAGGSAIPDPMAGIEQVRVDRGPTEAGDGGTISAPSPTQTGILIGGALLTIAAATFVLRRKGEPRVAT